VRAATDVTGFGLLGHARNLGRGSGCAVVVEAPALPLLPGVADLVAAGLVPGGSRNNLVFANTWTRWDGGVTELQRVIATDAQTSGGLLLSVAPDRAAALVAAITGEGGSAWEVGRLERGVPGTVRVVTQPVTGGRTHADISA